MKIYKLFATVAVTILMGSCSTPRIGYFQDVETGQAQQLTETKYIRVQNGDKLSILVSSKNPELAGLFNLPIVGHYSSSNSSASLNTSQIASYTVDPSGDIDFPILGKIHVEGLTRSEVAAKVKNELITRNLLLDPTVTVGFLDLYFSVVGEVNNPGRFNIDHDKVTILDAIGRAGDLTIYGRRDNVLVMREENGVQKAYRLDLTSSKQIYESPVFYLNQNDIVYIEPNNVKARQGTLNGNTVRSTAFWISLASLLSTIGVLIFK